MHLRLGLCPSIVRRPHATCACAQEDAGNTVAPGAISWSGLVPAQEDTSNTVASELLKWKWARLVKASACAEQKKTKKLLHFIGALQKYILCDKSQSAVQMEPRYAPHPSQESPRGKGRNFLACHI